MKKSTQIYFIASLLTIVGLVITIVLMNKNNPESKKYKQKMQAFENKVAFYEAMTDADVLFYEKNNPKQAMELLKSWDSNEMELEIIKSKIQNYQNFEKAIQSAKQNQALSSNISKNDASNLQFKIDSLNIANRKLKDSLVNQITDLKEKLIQNTKRKAGKDNIQVISFKGVRGDKIHYIGEVKENKANGNGVGIWVTGSVYKGEWKNNIRHGHGFYEWADGEKYDGTYENGKRKGFGKYFWPNGERYEGQWMDDKRNGKGILFDPDGNIRFEGDWADDKPLKN